MRLIDADKLKAEIVLALCIESPNHLLPSEKTIYRLINNAPTVSAEPQWTPIKKGYPTESGYYNVTIMGYLDDRLEPAVEYYSPNTARDKKRWKAINVIAWRPADVYRE